MYVVVAYDITSHQRRARLHELLLGYGTPVQKSVFECDLKRAQLRRLKAQATRYVKGPSDGIRYYQLCIGCRERTHHAGTTLEEGRAGGPYVV